MRDRAVGRRFVLFTMAMCVSAIFAPGVAHAQTVTYQPYIQPGDNPTFEARDQMIVAWQTNEGTPNPGAYTVEYGRTGRCGTHAFVAGRVVDNYLSADHTLPVPPAASGPHVNYVAALTSLAYDTRYYYCVSGPGLPPQGFSASFLSRTRGSRFSFLVEGDEGFFPTAPGTNPALMANYEARIVHLMYNAGRVPLTGEPQRPAPNLALNTGDNVYNVGAEGSYRDFWMPVWNSNVDSNETGAPFIRHIPYYIVAGNHDIGGNGDRANLLGSDSAPRFSGNLGGGDALAYYNNYYFPLNGPEGVDPQKVFNGDTFTTDGFFYSFLGKSYLSPAATEAFRASTAVDTGAGEKRQIDRMSNYSFDQGDAHFLFLDANPHLFNAVFDYTATWAAAPTGFTPYPSALREWIIRDLDGSSQFWKVVVFHQPPFSSGNATLRNNQMRAIVKTLEDHGVNVVFSGHEHNYQRTHPLRALDGVDHAPSTVGQPTVAIDARFDGVTQRVPDGVLYVVEGAGGNRDFDGDLTAPRGSGEGIDLDDSATGNFQVGPGQAYPNGSAGWLDTHLTNTAMQPFFADAGHGPKITVRFKAKVFSFAQVVVDDDHMTLFQISEPLRGTSSASPANPAPFGTDLRGRPLNDPIPDTLLDPTTGLLVSPPADGPSALLDKFTIERPDLRGRVSVHVSTSRRDRDGGFLSYRIHVDNRSPYALNGAQVVVPVPRRLVVVTPTDDTHTLTDDGFVITLGRIAAGEDADVVVRLALDVNPPLKRHDSDRDDDDDDFDRDDWGRRTADGIVLRSSTAQPVRATFGDR